MPTVLILTIYGSDRKENIFTNTVHHPSIIPDTEITGIIFFEDMSESN